MFGNTTLVPRWTTAVCGQNCLSFCLISTVWPCAAAPLTPSMYASAPLTAPPRPSTRPLTTPTRSPLLAAAVAVGADVDEAPDGGVTVPPGGVTGGGNAVVDGSCPPDCSSFSSMS